MNLALKRGTKPPMVVRTTSRTGDSVVISRKTRDKHGVVRKSTTTVVASPR